MKSFLRRRPSPALLIALLALFVSLGGVSYGVATGFIDSREIKNNTITSLDLRDNQVRTRDIRNNEVRGFDIRNSTVRGIDVALNTLTGADIAEDQLGKVPSAALADRATDADTLGGITVKKFFVKQPEATPMTEILRGPGFVLRASCISPDVDVQLDGIADAPETNASWHIGLDNPEDINADRDADLEAGDNIELIDLTSDLGGGTLVVSTTTGAVTTVVFHAQDAPAFEGENVCAMRGTVTAAP